MKEGASVYSSPDGLTWDQDFAKWSAMNVDPGFAVFRNPLKQSEVVVLSPENQSVIQTPQSPFLNFLGGY